MVSGTKVFLWQRASAAYLAIFLFWLFGYILVHPVGDYYSWHALFQKSAARVSAILFFFALAIHAWIGMWAVVTDYVKQAFVRFVFLLVIFGILCASLVWGIVVLWS